MTRELKDYTDFKVGSYWIYRDSTNSADLDSIFLFSHNQFIHPGDDGSDGPGPFEEFTDTLFSSINGKFAADGNGVNNDYHVKYVNWSNYETTYYTPISGVQLDEWGNMTLTNSSENLTVAGTLYQSVKEFKINSQGGYVVPTPITHIWWAKNIGVIQKTVSGTTWQLIRYHVAQ